MRGLVAGLQKHRLRRLIGERDGAPPHLGDPAPRARPLDVLQSALWLGLVTGPIEVGVVLALKPLSDPTPGLFHMNRHLLWMIPAFHAVLFGALGILLGLVARLRPRCAPRRLAFVLLFCAWLGVSLAIRSLHVMACVVFSIGLGYRLSRTFVPVLTGSSRVVRRSLPWLAAMGLAAIGLTIGREAWGERQSAAALAQPAPSTPNVVVIVMDTVSAAHMSLYGYARQTTPNLERLARTGVRFDHARSTAPWTLPSHASMFTGRWPHELSAGFGGPLDGEALTLAEYLRDRGYATGGFIANTLYCSAESGLGRGFLHFDDHEISLIAIIHSAALGQRLLEKAGLKLARLVHEGSHAGAHGDETDRPRKPYKDASQVEAAALHWLGHQTGRPFFLFLNLFDAHTPYLLPEGCSQHFGLAPADRSDYSTLNGFWGADKKKLSSRDVELARDAYDDCIGFMDAQLGRFHAALDARGLLRNTVIIITADHGEQFGGHGLFGHAGSLYRPEVHVPLIIIPPRSRAGLGADCLTVLEPVTLRNIPATVADLVGGADEAPFPGSSLARHWDPSKRSGMTRGDDPILSEVHSPATNNANHGRSPVFRGSMASVVAEGRIYIRNGDGVEELFDLVADPDERSNLAGRDDAQPVLRKLRADLDRALGGAKADVH